MHQYSRISCGRGDIFGLSPKDLTIEQLKVLRFEKLIECVSLDPRVPYMIAARMFGETPSKVSYLRNLHADEVLRCPQIVHSYNRYLDNYLANIESYARQDILIWHMMEERHKTTEVNRWANNERSIVNDDNVDYDFLIERWPDKVDKKIGKFLKKLLEDEYYKYGYGWNGVKHMIAAAPLKYIRPICGILFDKENKKIHKDLQIIALSNRHLPKEYTILALKLAAKKLYWPTINAHISKEVLEELPTVTRLNIIEKLIQLQYPISGLRDESDFRALMFGATMRHPERVEKAVRFFESIKPKEIK